MINVYVFTNLYMIMNIIYKNRYLNCNALWSAYPLNYKAVYLDLKDVCFQIKLEDFVFVTFTPLGLNILLINWGLK